MMLFKKWSGLIPINAGIVATLLAFRVIPRNPKDPEKLEKWHSKFGKLMKILGPFLIIFGFIKLFGGVA